MTRANDLRKICTSAKLVGIERYFGVIIFCLLYLVPSKWVLSIRQWRDPSWVIDLYVIVTTGLLAVVLYWSEYASLVSAWFASYLLAGTIVSVLNVIFLTKVFGPPASPERSLLLFILNVVQVVLTFAIWYRFMLGMLTGEAMFKAMLVFGTIGYPKGADVIVAAQIAIDFFLLAVFLAFILGNLGR